MEHCYNQLRHINVKINDEQSHHCLNQCRAVQNYTTLFKSIEINWLFKSMSSSPSDPMNQTLLSSCCLWLVTTTTYAHTFERGRFPYDAQEWENLEMRGWGRCLRKTKLHFVRKDKFIDIDFGEHKRLSWDLYWVLCPEEFYYWLIKVVRKQVGFAFEEVLRFWFLW